ncbi:hypothetical protein Tco_0717632 [Tanacetum coccineum]
MLVQSWTGNPQQDGCQFSWQKDHYMAMQNAIPLVANSTTEAEYVAAASCCGQVLWIQNQMSPKPIRIHFNRPITHAISSTDILDLQALISQLAVITLSKLYGCSLSPVPNHNMIAIWEKTPVVSTTFVEQFWTSAKSKTINNARHITAKVAGKLVSISEASIRTDLLFDDANGIDTLPNQAIFDAIQLMDLRDLTIFEGAEDQREGIEEKVESTAEQKERKSRRMEAEEEKNKIVKKKQLMKLSLKTLMRFIKQLNKKRGGLSKSKVIKEDTKEEVKDEDKDEESTRKRKLGTRKKDEVSKEDNIQHTSEDDVDKENDDLSYI